MPKRPRAVRRGEAGAEPRRRREAEAVVSIGPPAWHVEEKDRCRCPLCGLMTEPELIETGPYELELYLQRFGGRMPGSTAGYMEYQERPKAEVDELYSSTIRPAIFRLRDKFGL